MNNKLLMALKLEFLIPHGSRTIKQYIPQLNLFSKLEKMCDLGRSLCSLDDFHCAPVKISYKCGIIHLQRDHAGIVLDSYFIITTTGGCIGLTD